MTALWLGERCAHFPDHPHPLVGGPGREVAKAALGAGAALLSPRVASCTESPSGNPDLLLRGSSLMQGAWP